MLRRLSQSLLIIPLAIVGFLMILISIPVYVFKGELQPSDWFMDWLIEFYDL